MEENNIKIDDSFVMDNVSNKKSHTKKIRDNPWILSTFVLGILVLFLVLQSFGVSTVNITGNVISESSVERNINLVMENLFKINNFEIVDIELVDDIHLISIVVNGTTYQLASTLDGEFIRMPEGFWIRLSEIESTIAEMNVEVENSSEDDEIPMSSFDELPEGVVEQIL